MKNRHGDLVEIVYELSPCFRLVFGESDYTTKNGSAKGENLPLILGSNNSKGLP